jgi:hypothetical protein
MFNSCNNVKNFDFGNDPVQSLYNDCKKYYKMYILYTTET